MLADCDTGSIVGAMIMGAFLFVLIAYCILFTIGEMQKEKDKRDRYLARKRREDNDE